MPERTLTGCFGKLPSHGDFIRHNLDPDFAEIWDRWLQTCLFETRQQIGENWLNLYLESPVWRFALDAGIAGPRSMAGILLPSVDAVGRYFPFTLAAGLPPEMRALAVRQNKEWFDAAAAKALSILEPDFVFDDFLSGLGQLEPPRTDNEPYAGERWIESDGPAANDLLDLLMPCCAFWTEGSPNVAEGMLLSRSLPSSSRFAFMLGSGA